MSTNLSYLNQGDYERRIKFFKRISLNGFKEAFIRRPQLASLMISDLLVVARYTEDDVAFGSNLSIETIRIVKRGYLVMLSLHEQFDLIDFYFRVFMRRRDLVISNEPYMVNKGNDYDNSYCRV